MQIKLKGEYCGVEFFLIIFTFIYRGTLRSETTFGNWKPFKKNENAFYFTSKALFVLKIFKFLC